jgi:hypothetical protein
VPAFPFPFAPVQRVGGKRVPLDLADPVDPVDLFMPDLTS